jgi:hypothetical protein
MEYHDYYMNNDKKTYPLFLSNSKDEDAIVRDILIGKPVTRVSVAKKTNQKAQLLDSKLLRGGNFIVFNLDVFNIPHLGFSEKNNTPARRSDMIHAHLLSELGFEIRDTNQISLVHNRTFTEANIEKCSKKYFSDMIGALLIQYLYKGEKAFEERLVFHQNHIKNIITLLSDSNHVEMKNFEHEIKTLEQLDFQINSFEKSYFINEFEKFRELKNQLKLRLCKLVS